MSKVILHTTEGKITLTLDDENTPKTTQNFLNYVKAGFYEDTLFHRVIDGFMIQGGGLTPDMSSKATDAPVENEAKHAKPNTKGSIAMARTSDPHSASSQFFINVANNDFLNYTAENTQGWGYCVFGEVTEGMDIVMDISKVNTINKSGHQDVPEKEIRITQAKLIEEPTFA